MEGKNFGGKTIGGLENVKTLEGEIIGGWGNVKLWREKLLGGITLEDGFTVNQALR